MTDEVKRYRFAMDQFASCFCEMIEQDLGGWVDSDDHDRIVAELRARIDECERGEILTDKELVGAVIECVMSSTQSNRDMHCRKLQRHILAVEAERNARETECETLSADLAAALAPQETADPKTGCTCGATEAARNHKPYPHKASCARK